MNYSTTSRCLRLATSALAFSLTLPVLGQYYTDEQWYDPTDWFDGDDYDYVGWDEYSADQDWETFDWQDDWNYDYNNDYNQLSENNTSDMDSYRFNQRNQRWEENPSGSTSQDTPASFYIITFEPVGQQSQDQQTRNQNQSMRSRQQGQQERSMQSGQQSAMRSQDRNSTSSQWENREQRSSQQSQTFRGTVEAFRHTQLSDREGNQTTYSLAKVKLDNGRTVVMSLGEKEELQKLNLEKGDQVSIQGTTGRLGGQRILIAQRVSADGENVSVNGRVATFDQMNRSRPQSGQWDSRSQEPNQNQTQNRSQNRQQQANQTMQLRGTVADIESVQVDGAREAQSFARIELENGRSATVLLGTEQSLDDLDLEEGDFVMISGQQDTIEGKMVLRAQEIRVDGEPLKLSS